MAESRVIVPDGDWGWVIVFVIFMHHFVGGFLYASQSALFLAMQEHFDEGKSSSSWILATFTTVSMVFSPFAASFGNRFSYKTATFIGGFLLGFGAFLSFFANSIIVLVVGIGVISGLGNGFCYVSIITMCALYFNKRRSLAMGLGTSGVGLGTFVLPPLITWLEEEWTWRGMLLIISGCLFNVCVLALLLRPLAVVDVETEGEDNEVNEKSTFISCDDDVTVNENIDVVHSGPFLEVVRDDEDGIGTQNILESAMPLDVIPSPAGLISDNTPLTHNELKLNMASEIMRRNKDLSRSLNQNIHMSSENTHNANSNNRHRHFSSIQDIYNRRQYSSLDVTKDNHLHLLSDHEGRSLTNLSIMFMGSTYNIKAIDSKISSMLSLHSKKSVIPTESLIEKKQHHSCNDYIHRLLCALKVHTALIRDWKCLLLLIVNFLVNLTYLSPILNLVDRAVDNGIDKPSAMLALSFYGAGNTLGRILTGVVADFQCSNRTVLYFLCLFLCGSVTCLSVFCGPYFPMHAAYGFMFGLLIGGYVVLTPLVLVDILGLEVVSQSVGLCLFFQGFASLTGSPLAGWIADITGSYTIPFIAFGSCLICSGLLLLPIIYHMLKGDKHLNET